MPLRARVKTGFYKDSVALMRLSETLGKLPGIGKVTVVMATPANKDILKDAGLLTTEAEKAKPDDLVAVVEGSVAATEQAFAVLDELLAASTTTSDGGGAIKARPRAIAQALAARNDLTLALISVPGPFAAAEALKAVRGGLDVLLFSDNVPIEQERAIKEVARAKGRLVMGPDCGTAIVGGVPLGFANVVRRGRIGLVAASGTGLQQATCLIDGLGEGVSQAIGTGGRDVSAAVGGITMRQGLAMLADDPATKVIVMMAKPPAPAVAVAILDQAARVKKPVVVNFLGGDAAALRGRKNLIWAETLEDAASAAVGALRRKKIGPAKPDKPPASAASARRRLAPGQIGLRALFSGGTFCAEAQMLWRLAGLRVHSNVPLDKTLAWRAGAKGQTHVALDLGSDEYTLGRPHPMIDPTERLAAIARAAKDPTVAVLLLDVVLGFGAHADPAGVLVPAIRAAQATAKRNGRVLPIVCFVCGTEADPQKRSQQEATLRQAGAILTASSTRAAWLAAALVARPRR